MKRHEKIVNWLWIGVIAIDVNFIVFLFADFSLRYFFGFIVFIGLFVWETINLVKYNQVSYCYHRDCN